MIMSYILIQFLLHLLVGALFICGWFAITRGSIEIMPDGSQKRVGKIFMGWYFFWYREHSRKLKIYYRGDELRKLLVQMDNSSTFKLSIESINDDRIEIIGSLVPKWIDEMIQKFGIIIEDKQILRTGNHIVSFAKEYPNYVFPTWLRDVMAGCVTCHSSWLGTICFCIPQLWFTYPVTVSGEILMLWVGYCISEAFIVTALWRKYMI